MKLEAKPMAHLTAKVKQKVPAVIQTEQQLRDIMVGLMPASVETLKQALENPLVTPKLKVETAQYIIDKFLQEQPGGWNREDLTKLSFDKRKDLARQLFISLAESMAQRAGAVKSQQSRGREETERVIDALSIDSGLPGKPQDGDVPTVSSTGAISSNPEADPGLLGGERSGENDFGGDGGVLPSDGHSPSS